MSAATLLGLLLVSATLPAVVRQLYPPVPDGVAADMATAVVVLGGGMKEHNGGWVASSASLRRLGEAVRVARSRQLPLLIAGGNADPATGRPSEAALMAQVARDIYPDGDIWLEPDSSNTRENVAFSVPLLQQRKVAAAILVTDRSHLPRAMLCFDWEGFPVSPHPVDRMPDPSWMPSVGALSHLPEIWYEWLALLWYHIHYD
ncbi:MAG: YdcF family protein [Alcanivoracaceae bacterium]